jgi:5S rRNA maturation endonuclease (ribonuclease M5)
VRGDKGFCRSCNIKGGDIIDWHQRIDGTDLARLMKKYGIGNGNGKQQVKPEIVKIYDYTDAAGQLVFQVCRMEPKDFRQRRPDGNGGWIWKTKGIKPVLYHLPEVIGADEILIVEGEKDADSLSKLGFTATTNSGGAGKWRDNYSGCLKGKQVVIIPDNDEPGRNHAAQVARSLVGIASSIKIINLTELPTKGDVTDFIKNFEDPQEAAERIAIMADGAEPYAPGNEPEADPQTCGITMQDLCQKEFAPVLWLLPGVFPSGSLYLAGPPKLGKSVFITNLAVAVATDGVVYGDHVCGTGDAIYLAMEDNERRLKNRIIANLGQRKPTDRLKLITMQDRWPVLGEGCLTRLRREIDSLPDTRLVIIDTLKRIRPKTNGSKKQQYDADYDDLTRIHALTVEYPMVLFVIIGHTRKMAAEDIYDTISGTQGLSGAVDTLAVFAGMRGVGKAKLYVDGRDVMGVKKSVVYDKPTWTWKITGDISDIEATQNQDKIFEVMKRYGKKDGLTPTDIAGLSSVNKETVRKQLYQWLESEVVEKKSYGRYGLSAGAEKAGSLNKMLLNNIEDPTVERYK